MSYKFFQNNSCEYFPCHAGKECNCLFCYCPLYLMECPGNPSYLSNGVKDCSHCEFPHKPENYEKIMEFLRKELF